MCLRGDNEHLALFESEAFVVEDTSGKNWICFLIPQERAESLSLVDHVDDLHRARAVLENDGLSTEGT